MNTLADQIEGLSRDQAIEAAQFLSRSLSRGQEVGEDEMAALAPLLAQPYEYVDEVEQLARVTLLAAAATPEYEANVRKAIAGTGRKQVILGGADIVALAGIGLLALDVIITRGKSEETVSSEFISQDGTKVNISKTTRFGISGRLGNILKSYFGVNT
jgi:hypothetical protein